jgi:hypothetical protein
VKKEKGKMTVNFAATFPFSFFTFPFLDDRWPVPLAAGGGPPWISKGGRHLPGLGWKSEIRNSKTTTSRFSSFEIRISNFRVAVDERVTMQPVTVRRRLKRGASSVPWNTSAPDDPAAPTDNAIRDQRG